MKASRIMMAAPQSGSGKTLITCALLEVLKAQGKNVEAFKCGPDFIDPMFHEKVLGISSRNLDCFFSDADQVRELFLCDKEEKTENISVIEGVMGLYDGLGGIREEASSYHLTKILQTPIVLVVDAKGMGRSILAMLAGFLKYDEEHLIKGVILNRISRSFCDTLAPLIETELGLAVLGCFPEQKKLKFESRHLGLRLPGEVSGLEENLRQAAEVLKEHVDVQKLLEIAQGAPELEERVSASDIPAEKVRIGIAYDEAFCFYYADNLRMLREMGAELVPFSPIRDQCLPENTHGILLGGGYPEIWAKQLSENESMRLSIKEAIERGMPSVAECGGFLYLQRTLTEEDGKETYPMCGVLQGECHNTGHPVRFGYVTITAKRDCFLPDKGSIKAHEFHYYDTSDNGQDCHAAKPIGNRSWECVYADKNHWWGFAHLYYPSNPDFVKNFIKRALEYKNET